MFYYTKMLTGKQMSPDEIEVIVAECINESTCTYVIFLRVSLVGFTSSPQKSNNSVVAL